LRLPDARLMRPARVLTWASTWRRSLWLLVGGREWPLSACRDLLRYIVMQRQGDIMTAHAITGRRFHRDDRIHFMTAHEGRQGPYGRRRRGRHFGPGPGVGRRAG